MKRKLTALILAFAMLACLSSAAAAQEAAPTVDQILNEYHQKAFEKQMQGEAAAVSTWSRSGSEQKTLEQETVDALTAAGYEAYNVTAANYDALEAELNTDFVDMGLDPNGSYIIVIEAEADVENVSGNAGNNTRASPETDLEGPDHPGTLPTTYTYGGITYSLRHITATSASGLQSSDNATLDEKGYIPDSWIEIEGLSLLAAGGSTAYVAIKDIEWLITEINNQGNYAFPAPEDLRVYVETAWTRKYIEVYDEADKKWEPRQCSEFASAAAWFCCTIEEVLTDVEVVYTQNRSYSNLYSVDYYDIDTRVFEAAAAQRWNDKAHDKVDVTYYIDEGDAAINPNSKVMFTHSSPAF